MKKILAQYPSVYYQILLLFLIGEIAYSQCSFDLSPLYSIAGFENPNHYKYLITSILYITSGYIVELIKDFKKGIITSIILLSIGFVLTTFNYEDYYYLYFIGGFFSEIGHAIFFIFCILHIGLLFPIANDWKDMAFTILLIIPFLGINFKYLFLNTYYEIIINIYSAGFGIFLVSIVLLFILISQFKHLGFSIETIEESHEKENVEERNFINLAMIGIILTSFAFAFISKNLHDLDFYQNNFNGWEEISYYFDKSVLWLMSFLFFSVLVPAGLLLKFAKQISSQFQKIFFIIILFLFIGALQVFLSQPESSFISFFSSFIFQIILIPILLSIITHVNLDQKIGIWIGLFLGVPFLTNQLLISFFLKENMINSFPYIAFLLLILILIVFRENRDFLEKKLELNESNRVKNEEENDIDIMEHFIEK